MKDSSLVYVLWLFNLNKCLHLVILMLFLHDFPLCNTVHNAVHNEWDLNILSFKKNTKKDKMVYKIHYHLNV